MPVSNIGHATPLIAEPQILPTGPCSIPADGQPCIPATGSCAIEKELDITIPNFLNLSAQGYLDRIELMWNTAIPYPDQIVNFVYRQYDVELAGIAEYYDSPKTAPRDDGMIATVNTLPQYTFFDLFIRAENATHHGYWQHITGITDPAWNTDSEIVIHAGEFVYHVDDIVLFDPS